MAKGHVMDDPVVPYFPRSNGSSTTISSSQSGHSIADRCVINGYHSYYSSDVLCSTGPSPNPTPSLPQKPSPVVYRINRSGSFQQADRWQQWNGVQTRRTGTGSDASRSNSRGSRNNIISPDYVPSIGRLDMDVDSYFKRASHISSHDSVSVTTSDTMASIGDQSNGDVIDHVPRPNVVVEQECGPENGADVASQSSVTDIKRYTITLTALWSIHLHFP